MFSELLQCSGASPRAIPSLSAPRQNAQSPGPAASAAEANNKLTVKIYRTLGFYQGCDRVLRKKGGITTMRFVAIAVLAAAFLAGAAKDEVIYIDSQKVPANFA